MKSAVDTAPAGALHALTMADALAELLAYLRSRPDLVDPISVDAETAAKLVGCCSKTLAGLPAAEVGRLKLNRRTLYDLTTLRAYIRSQIAK